MSNQDGSASKLGSSALHYKRSLIGAVMVVDSGQGIVRVVPILIEHTRPSFSSASIHHQHLTLALHMISGEQRLSHLGLIAGIVRQTTSILRHCVPHLSKDCPL